MSGQDKKSERNHNLIELDFKRIKTTSLQTWCSFLYFKDVAVWFLRRQSFIKTDTNLGHLVKDNETQISLGWSH